MGIGLAVADAGSFCARCARYISVCHGYFSSFIRSRRARRVKVRSPIDIFDRPDPSHSIRYRQIACAVVLGCAVLLLPKAAQAQSDFWKTLSSVFDRKGGVQSKYPIIDSRTTVYTLGVGAPQFYWINNDELLFVPMQITPDASAPNGARVNFSLARWHTRTGAITKLRDFGTGEPRLCFLEGYLLLVVIERDNTRRVYHGPLGAERADNADRRFNYVLCRPTDELPGPPAWTEGRHIRWLEQPNSGFIDFGELKQGINYEPLVLYTPGAGQTEGIQLPLYRRRTIPRFPYFPFKDAFFVESNWHVHPRPKDIAYPVYWLYRDGRVERIADIPWGAWRATSDFTVVPTRAGLLLISSNVRSPTDLANAGLYLLTAQKIEKLSTAWIEGHSVAMSPNGCRAAFTYATTITQKRNILQVIDLCSGVAP